MTAQMTPSTARLELMILEAESEAIGSSDFYAWLRDAGLPPELAIRVKELAGATSLIAGKVVHIGRILLLKLIEFVKAHPNLATGLALGAGVSLLVASIPLLGPLLAPLALVLGVAIGAFVGNRMDLRAAETGGGIPASQLSVTEQAIDLARMFFVQLIELLQKLGDALSFDGECIVK